MKKKMIEFSIVIPVYNSAEILKDLHARLVAVMEALGEPFEMIFVDDGSGDNAWRVLESISSIDERALAFQLMRNSGQGVSTLCGLSHAKGEFVITLDDDLQHPPEMIPSLIHKLKSDPEIDVIMGVPEKKRHHFVRRIGSRVVNHMNNFLLKKDKRLRFSSFRAIRRPIARALSEMRTPYPAIGPMILSVTSRIANVYVRHDPREKGRSNYIASRLVKQTMSNFIGYSMLPLRLLAIFVATGIAVSLIYGAMLFLMYTIYGISVPGWLTIVLLLLLMSGFNFFAFAVLVEYLSRIFYLETNKKQFVLRNTIGAARDVADTENPVDSTNRHQEFR